MGLFDWYQPAQELLCPVDGHPLRNWQGKDGPCLQFHWEEGEPHPIGHDFDYSVGEGVPRHYWHEFTLPKTFIIYSYDCPAHHPIEAQGSTQDGTWRSTVVLNNKVWEERVASLKQATAHLQRRKRQASVHGTEDREVDQAD